MRDAACLDFGALTHEQLNFLLPNGEDISLLVSLFPFPIILDLPTDVKFIQVVYYTFIIVRISSNDIAFLLKLFLYFSFTCHIEKYSKECTLPFRIWIENRMTFLLPKKIFSQV